MSDHAPSAQVLPLSKSTGEKNFPSPKDSGVQNISYHQKATLEVATMFIAVFISTKTLSPILSNGKYLTV